MTITHNHLHQANPDSDYLFGDLDVAVSQGDPRAIDAEAAALVSLINEVKSSFPDTAPKGGGETVAEVIGSKLGTASVWSAMYALEATPTEATTALAKETVRYFPGSARAVFPKALDLTLSEGLPFSDALDVATGKSPSFAPEKNDPDATIRKVKS